MGQSVPRACFTPTAPRRLQPEPLGNLGCGSTEEHEAWIRSCWETSAVVPLRNMKLESGAAGKPRLWFHWGTGSSNQELLGNLRLWFHWGTGSSNQELLGNLGCGSTEEHEAWIRSCWETSAVVPLSWTWSLNQELLGNLGSVVLTEEGWSLNSGAAGIWPRLWFHWGTWSSNIELLGNWNWSLCSW